MGAPEILSEVVRRGGVVRPVVEGGRLRLAVDPPSALDDEARAAIREHRAALLWLAADPEVAWRAAVMLERVAGARAAGRPVPVLEARSIPSTPKPGRCGSCGDGFVDTKSPTFGRALVCPACVLASHLALEVARPAPWVPHIVPDDPPRFPVVEVRPVQPPSDGVAELAAMLIPDERAIIPSEGDPIPSWTKVLTRALAVWSLERKGLDGEAVVTEACARGLVIERAPYLVSPEPPEPPPGWSAPPCAPEVTGEAIGPDDDLDLDDVEVGLSRQGAAAREVIFVALDRSVFGVVTKEPNGALPAGTFLARRADVDAALADAGFDAVDLDAALAAQAVVAFGPYIVKSVRS